jgi:hypothetical protein
MKIESGSETYRCSRTQRATLSDTAVVISLDDPPERFFVRYYWPSCADARAYYQNLAT